ncbi:MAG: BadF/BadG/BcrA/BcrD ATPase family protein [Paracoccaceae bacterium]
MKIAGIDIGSTTVKGVVLADGEVVWRRYGRHDTRQAEKTLELLTLMEEEAGLRPGEDITVYAGSGAGPIAPLSGGRTIQEVVAVAAAVEALHSDVRFVSEIGGEDMKTIFFTPTDAGKAKQVYMQSACSGGTGTFIEKSARNLEISPGRLASMAYADKTLHRISAKCGIFAEADANSLVKSGVPEDEIIASFFEAVVRQNLATLTKGNTPMPSALLLGGPNMFFQGLREAWIRHLSELWQDRGIALPDGRTVEELITVPDDALYYACLGCAEIARREREVHKPYTGTDRLRWWVEEGQVAAKKKEGKPALGGDRRELGEFLRTYGGKRVAFVSRPATEPMVMGCDFGSTTVKAIALTADREPSVSCYLPSRGNPIEDAKAIFAQMNERGVREVRGLGITGYGKDLLKDIVGADVPVVETVAHATAARHFFPDADAICDVGGCDVKIMLLRQNTVADFRLNSQCSSGNGAFLQGVAERYAIDLDDYADRAFEARSMPELMMGCGVFLQSDIVNQQRNGWSPEEIMAGLASVLPLNVWIYAGQFQNLSAAGRKFVLQGGTHRNLAVVKAQVDFIRQKVPGSEIMVHPFCGEAGAFGAALLAAGNADDGAPTRFPGFERIEELEFSTTTTERTACRWCAMNCRRSFVDVKMPGGRGRPDSKVPLGEGWERVITGNSCPRGLIEDANEYRLHKSKLEEAKHAYPNLAETVRDTAFR